MKRDLITMYTRKIQQTGKSTFIVSLPRQWVEDYKLNKSSPLLLIPLPNGLLVKPPNLDILAETSFKVKSEDDAEKITRLFFSKYLRGYTRIRVSFPEQSLQQISILKERIRRWLVGVEIVEESSTELVAQCLPMHEKFPVKTSLERMGDITANMITDSVKAVVEGDVSTAEEIVKRDDEVDRFYHFVTRQLNVAILQVEVLKSLQINDPRDIVSYVLTAKSIERTADHTVTICNSVRFVSKGLTEAGKLVEIGVKLNNIFRKSLQAFLDIDVEKANEVFLLAQECDKVLDEAAALKTLSAERLPLTLVFNSLKRIAEYSADIAESTVNIAADGSAK